MPQITMDSWLKAERKANNHNFTQCEVEVLVGEVEKRKDVLFGGHSVGITNGNVADNVNDVASEGWSVAEVKKKVAGEQANRSSPCWMKNWWGSFGNPSWVEWGTPMPAHKKQKTPVCNLYSHIGPQGQWRG